MSVVNAAGWFWQWFAAHGLKIKAIATATLTGDRVRYEAHAVLKNDSSAHVAIRRVQLIPPAGPTLFLGPDGPRVLRPGRATEWTMRGVVLATRRRTLPPGDDGRNTDGRVRLPWFAEDIQSLQESLLTDRKRQATFVVTTEAYDQRVYTARFEMCERPSDAPDLVRCARGT